MKNMKREVTLKWTAPKPCPPRPNTSKFHMRKSSFFTIGAVRLFFAGFGVCSDDWRKKKEEEEMINTKENGKDNLKEQMFEQEKKISKRKGKRK